MKKPRHDGAIGARQGEEAATAGGDAAAVVRGPSPMMIARVKPLSGALGPCPQDGVRAPWALPHPAPRGIADSTTGNPCHRPPRALPADARGARRMQGVEAATNDAPDPEVSAIPNVVRREEEDGTRTTNLMLSTPRDVGSVTPSRGTLVQHPSPPRSSAMAGRRKHPDAKGDPGARLQMRRRRGQAHERRLAKALGGEQVPGSGALGEPGDVRTRDFLVQCKSVENRALDFRVAVIEKADAEAVNEGRTPLIAFEFLALSDDIGKDWVLMPLRVFDALLAARKAATDASPQVVSG